MAGKWDEEEEEETPIVVSKPTASKKFADEDASDEDVKDDWDAESEEEAPVKAAVVIGSMRAKGVTKNKIAAKEEAERVRAEEKAALNGEDLNTRKAKERDAMLASDMDNAAMLLGNTTIADYVDPFSMKARTAEDFNALSTAFSNQLIASYGKHPLYATFILQFAREICAPLKDVDVRKTATGLTTLGNEKQKEQRENAPGGKKKSKGASRPGLGAGKDVGCRGNDTGTYQEALDDGEFDDFM